MAQYDGSIRINTGLELKNLKRDTQEAERILKSTAKRISDMEKNASSSDAFKDVQKQIVKTEERLQGLKDKQKAWLEAGGGEESGYFKDVTAEIDKFQSKLESLQGKLKSLSGSGQGVSFSSESEQEAYNNAILRRQQLTERIESNNQRIAELQAQEVTEEERLAQIRENAVVGNQRIVEAVERRKELLQEIKDLERADVGAGYQQYDNAQQELARLNQEIRDYSNGTDVVKEKYRQLSSAAKTAFNSIGKALKKANSLIDSFGKRIKQAFLNFSKSADGANNNALTASKILKSILKYGLGIRSLYVLVNKIRNGIKEGFSNFMEYSSKFKSSIDSIKASTLTLKNAFAAAFAPLVEMAIPYIQRVVEWLTKLLNIIGQVMAAITGQETYTRAIKQTTAAIEDQNKAQNKQLSGLDKLNNLTSSSGGGGADGGAADMFEEAPIEDKWKKTADKIKEIGKNLFAPLKAAWDKEGKFVMDSWKYALDEIKKLAKDIGRDFMTVWNQPETIAMFEDIFHIVGDIGLVVGNLARNFRAAWNENKVGLHIFENIRDILAVIIHNIRLAADYTVAWSDKLDFYPLLSKIEEWTKSLIPVFDALSGIVMDFYTMVLLPLAKWTLEKGLPELLQVFIDFNNKVDWEALRSRLAQFWEHLEPFAETVGEGLIIFIGRVSDALADFINSEAFNNFLTRIEEWMDSVTPEDVANGLEMIAKGLIALKLALLGFGAISALTGVFTTIKSFLAFFASFGKTIAGGAKMVASGVSAIVSSLGGILPTLAIVAAAVGGWNIGSLIAEKLELDPKPFGETMGEIKSSFTDGSWKEALKLWGDDIYNAFVTLGERQEEKFNEIKENISKTWASIKESASEKWGDIKKNLSGKWEDMKTNASTIFTDLKTSLSGIWDEISTAVSDKWNGIKKTISGVVDDVKGKIDGFIDKVKDAIQSVKDFLSSGFDKIGSAISGMFSGGGTSAYSGASPYSAMPQMAALSKMEFPGYATGQVIPTSMKKHLAWLGDNKHETEVVSPLSTMKQANKEAILEVLSELGMTGGNGRSAGSETYVFQVDGKTFFEVTRKEAQQYFSRTGRSPYPV